MSSPCVQIHSGVITQVCRRDVVHIVHRGHSQEPHTPSSPPSNTQARNNSSDIEEETNRERELKRTQCKNMLTPISPTHLPIWKRWGSSLETGY